MTFLTEIQEVLVMRWGSRRFFNIHTLLDSGASNIAYDHSLLPPLRLDYVLHADREQEASDAACQNVVSSHVDLMFEDLVIMRNWCFGHTHA